MWVRVIHNTRRWLVNTGGTWCPYFLCLSMARFHWVQFSADENVQKQMWSFTFCWNCSLIFMSSTGIHLHFATSRIRRGVVSPFSFKVLSPYLDFDLYVPLSWLLILNSSQWGGNEVCLWSCSTWQGYLLIRNQYKHLSNESWWL